ncbi:unnamed protein product [Rotaria sordida]|uniref:Uncharacterized protein n=1 Tax=Rotaria sordida TaxID=392033 RepID=A0A815R9Q7_9BILA|nr:unnamed protein product [Rotaria sordida]
MSTVEVNGAGNSHPDELIQSSSNEQISRSYNRTRSVQYPNEYESASHTPKRNPKETPDFNSGIDQHPSNSNDSSNRLRRESPQQAFLLFRITLQDVNQYPTTELDKIPSSYSIVVQNVPSQWSAQAFDNELKQHYPSIVRVVRIFISGGRPFSKVRVDFSSYKELSMILKSKLILLDDDNTAFDVEPYLLPT